jgi:hypothetical protein
MLDNQTLRRVLVLDSSIQIFELLSPEYLRDELPSTFNLPGVLE